MPKMLAFIDGSIYSDSVCDHVIWAAAGDEFDVSLFNVIEGVYTAGGPSNFSGNLGAEAKSKLLVDFCRFQLILQLIPTRYKPSSFSIFD